MEIFIRVLTVIGALGVFLFGMKLMSESLQKVAGNRLRGTLSTITSNRYRGLLTGLLVTGLLQSSSAVTVMTVSFVNGGLITLTESAGLIMGANIGTTVKLWLISTLGFGRTFSISEIALPLIAISLPFFFSNNSRGKSFGEFLIGFSFLLIGLDFMKEQVPHLDPDSQFIHWLASLTADSAVVNLLVFMLAGILLTLAFQSSSVTITLTIVLATEGWITYEMAAAMVLGENIGTTSTALLASIVANNSGKRAALLHLLFNLVGVLWAAPLLFYILQAISSLTENLFGSSPTSSPDAIPLALAILHTSFNTINAFLLIGFTKPLINITQRVIPTKGKKKERSQLRFFNIRTLALPEISLLQAKNEASLMGKHAFEMFQIIPEILVCMDEEQFRVHLKKMKKYEKKMDRIRAEMTDYLVKLSEGMLSEAGSGELQAILRVIDEIEGIGDACYRMTNILERRHKEKIYFIQDLRDKLQEMFDLIKSALQIMNENLSMDYQKIDLTKALSIEKRIDLMRDELKQDQLISIKEGKYTYQTGMVFSELVTQAEKLGDLALNVSESLYHSRDGSGNKP
jgi:phosphate:Na+ symporter